jgi:hypothetical protein
MSWNINTRLNNLQQQINNIANEGLTNPLEQILNANNYALQNLSTLDGGSNILNINTSNLDGIKMNNKLEVSGDVSCNTLNCSNFNPPIPAPSLSQVLTTSDDALGLSIDNLGGLTMSSGSTIHFTNADIDGLTNLSVNDRLTIFNNSQEPDDTSAELSLSNLNNTYNIVNQTLNNINNLTISDDDYNYMTIQKGNVQVKFNSVYSAGYVDIGNAQSNLSQMRLLYGDGTGTGDNYSIWAYLNTLYVQQYRNNGLYYQPLSIDDKEKIELRTENLIYSGATGTTGSYIIDSLYNTPMYKQVFSGITGNFINFRTTPRIFMSSSIYSGSTSSGYTNGVNYGEILFSSLNLTFNETGGTGTFNSGTNATLFLSSTGTDTQYDATKGNSIVIPMKTGATSSTFNSTIPILLYCNSTTQFNKVYLMLFLNQIPNLPATGYTATMSASNFVVSGYITTNQNGVINFGS